MIDCWLSPSFLSLLYLKNLTLFKSLALVMQVYSHSGYFFTKSGCNQKLLFEYPLADLALNAL